MADAMISVVAEQLFAIVSEQIKNELRLVSGVEKELVDLSEELNTLKGVFNDTDWRQSKEKSVRDWLWKLEQTSYEMEDVLDEWNYALLKHKMESESAAPLMQKVCSFIPSSCVCLMRLEERHIIGMKIQHVKSKFAKILTEKNIHIAVISQNNDASPESPREETTSSVEKEEIQGREGDTDILVSKLTASHEGLSYHILSIVGVGGLGKTTLAQLVFNDSRVQNCFDVKIWLYVSDTFNAAVIMKDIIESIELRASPDTTQLGSLVKVLINSISGKKVFLVLDDVWSEKIENWKQFVNALKGSASSCKILVTTRNVRAAMNMGTADEDIHHLKLLSDNDCWLMLSSSALLESSGRQIDMFREIGLKIAKRCNGMPLAAKTMGILLKNANIQEWQKLLESEMCDLEQLKKELFRLLHSSYDELSITVKRCFSYCAIFPKEKNIQVGQLKGIWMALGYLGSKMGSAGDDIEVKGRQYFEDIALRSLFHEFEEDDSTQQIISCKMQYIVHDFAQFVWKNDRAEAPGETNRTCQNCNPILVSEAEEYRSLFWDQESPPNLCCECFRSLRVLGFTKKMSSCPQGMENLIHVRWLDISGTTLSTEELDTICKLYFLQTLLLASCSITEIPWAIGNLVYLAQLHLSWNRELRELPNSMGSLCELQTLDMEGCSNLRGLPEWIVKLAKLKHLHIKHTFISRCFPQGIAQISGLRTLNEFQGGSGCNKLELLKNLNDLRGSLLLGIKFTSIRDLEELVEDAGEAELRNKFYIRTLHIQFKDEMDEKESSSLLWLEVIEALKPNQNLNNLVIRRYEGSRLPHWISSPLNRLRSIGLYYFSRLSSLPPMGKLQYLERLHVEGLKELKLVGRELLGTDQSVFPKLKKLTFEECPKWEEWEDITVEEEKSESVSIMPCLTELNILSCEGLKKLPHRLMSKAKSLQLLDIRLSSELEKCYGNKDGLPWKSISVIHPQLQVRMYR